MDNKPAPKQKAVKNSIAVEKLKEEISILGSLGWHTDIRINFHLDNTFFLFLKSAASHKNLCILEAAALIAL